MPMNSRDRDILLAETIERILNKLEENNQAALDEAGLMRRAQNALRSFSGRVGDVVKGRFKDQSLGVGEDSARDKLNSLTEIKPGVYYYFLDLSGKWSSDSKYYTLDSFSRFRPVDEREGGREVVLPIPEGANLADGKVTAKTTVGSVIFDFRFKDLADKLAISPKAIVARKLEFRYDFASGKWIKVFTGSIRIDDLVEANNNIKEGEYSERLVKSHRIGLGRRMTRLGRNQRTYRAGYSDDDKYSGRYFGIDVSDQAILEIPGMEKAMQAYNEKLGLTPEGEDKPTKSWEMSSSLRELGTAVESMESSGTIPHSIRPKIAIEALLLAQSEESGGGPLDIPPIDRVTSYSGAQKYLSPMFTSIPLPTAISDAISYISSQSIKGQETIIQILSDFAKTAKSSKSKGSKSKGSSGSSGSASTSSVELTAILGGEKNPSKSWTLSRTILDAYSKIESINSELVPEILSDSSVASTLGEAYLMAVMDITYVYYRDVYGSSLKKAPTPNFATTNTPGKAAKWFESFIHAAERIPVGRVSSSTIASKLDRIVNAIQSTSVLKAETSKGLVDELKDIQKRIELGPAYTEPEVA